MVTRNEQIGRIGEKLVEIELLKRNIDFLSMSDNHPYFDLIIDTKNGLKKVQIKTSRLNKKGKFQFFLKNCVGGYDYLILVGMIEKSFKENIFYILPKGELFNSDIQRCIMNPQTGINISYKNGFKYNKFKENWLILCN